MRCGDDLWRHESLVSGLNRVEADELSYGIHILIRTDLKSLCSRRDCQCGSPFEWNRRYGDARCQPSDDAEGCLPGRAPERGFALFPLVSVGTSISAQLSEAMADRSGHREHVAAGDVRPLLDWLNYVHPIGGPQC